MPDGNLRKGIESAAGEVADGRIFGAAVGRAPEVEGIALPNSVNPAELRIEGEMEIGGEIHDDTAGGLRHGCASE